MTTSIKTCFKCNLEKGRGDFYAHPQMKDGLLGKCKTCTKKDVTARRNAKIEDVRAYDRARGSRQDKVYLANYRAENPLKYAAHKAVRGARMKGDLLPLPCEVCFSTHDLHAHHDDYSKPLEVRWLCSKHHSQWHRDNPDAQLVPF